MITDVRMAALRRRYGHHTTGPNWQAEDYLDGPAKDRLLNQAKSDVRDLLDEVDQLRAKVARVEAYAQHLEDAAAQPATAVELRAQAAEIRALLAEQEEDA